MRNPKITIVTPTFNRAYILPKVYASLVLQTEKDFEWIIVDDGSEDETKTLVEVWFLENKIPISYFYQPNKGKHFAVNKGIKEANGDFLFVLDSDDYILDQAIEEVLKLINKIDNNPKIAAVTFINGREYKEVAKIFRGGEEIIANDHVFKYEWDIQGEMCIFMRTHLLKKNLYPEISGEKFCPESLIYKRIANDYDFFYYIKVLALGDYLPDGLSSKYWQMIQNSPKTNMIYYSELANNPKVEVERRKNAAKIFIDLAFTQPKSELLKNLTKIPLQFAVKALKDKILKKITA